MIKNLRAFTSIAVLAVMIVWTPTLFPTNSVASALVKPYQAATAVSKTIKYRVEVSNPGNTSMRNPSVIIAVPTNSPRHVVRDLSVSIPYKKVVDALGNVSVDIDFSFVAPYETKIINITVRLDKPLNQSKDVSEDDRYTQAERFIESNNPKIVRQARVFKGDSERVRAKEAYDWVVANVSDSGFIEEDRGALYTLDHKTADCTGYMYLYGALLRANGIPTKMMSGFVVDRNQKLNIKDYHNWAEVKLDGIWRVVDPQKGKFLEDEASYVAMRMIDHTKDNRFDNSQQLFSTDSDLIVRMN